MDKSKKAFFRYCLYLLVIIASLFCVKITVNAYETDKCILILNSYHKGLSWTDQTTEGIVKTLKRQSGYSVAVEYMDWKNYPTHENLNQLYTKLYYKYAKKKIDIVITTDDAALEFALGNRQEVFSNAPIVFCGVNEDGANKLVDKYTNVTGVLEILDPDKTIKTALKLNPMINEICVAFDNSESGVSIGNLTMDAIKNIDPSIKITTLNKKSIDEVLQDAAQAPPNSIMLITTYYKDANDTSIGFEDFCKMVSGVSTVPVYHLFDFGLGNGAIGGSMISGALQGVKAGEIALRVLQGEDTSKIPFYKEKTTRYILDYIQLTRYNINLHDIPQDSEILNKPSSFVETYGPILKTASIIFSLLVAFIFVLLFYLKKINRLRTELMDNHHTLTRLYEDLRSSDSKLQQQYNKLILTQENLTSSEKRYTLLFEKMLNGYFIFEPVLSNEGKLMDLRFMNVNPSVERQTGLKAENFIGKRWTEVVGYPNPDLKIYMNVLNTGEAERFETYYKEVHTYYLVNTFKISNNQIGVVFDNISEYKQAIKEIRTLNFELEDRVIKRTTELQEAVKELEAFTYTVSHDLKSPLRAVDGYSKIIIEDYGDKLDEEAREMTNNIRNICKDMIEMINKLLQYSTTSKTYLVKEDLNSKDIILTIFNDLKLTCPERNIDLIIETGLPTILVDKVLFKQAIYNLLSNALKFTRDRDKAIITIGSSITENNYLFYIKDNGVGFDMEFSSKLFGIFQRLHTIDEFEGSGIGLVTVKKIIQKHGGEIWIEGKVDEGATVYFTLPFSWQ